MFAGQEVHGPLDVLHRDAAADVGLGRLDPHLSEQVHHACNTVQRGDEEPGLSGCGIRCSERASLHLTWLAVRLLEGVQPVEAEHLLAVGPLGQRQAAGVHLDLSRSLAGALVLLSPAPDPAGPGRETIRVNI